MELTYRLGDTRKKILLVHGSPQSNSEYVYEGDTKQEMVAALKHREVDILVMGHTHFSYVHQNGSVLFVNSGSVGRSKESPTKAMYAILRIDEQNVSAEIVKLDYDTTAVVQAIKNSDIRDFYAEFFQKQ